MLKTFYLTGGKNEFYLRDMGGVMNRSQIFFSSNFQDAENGSSTNDVQGGPYVFARFSSIKDYKNGQKHMANKAVTSKSLIS